MKGKKEEKNWDGSKFMKFAELNKLKKRVKTKHKKFGKEGIYFFQYKYFNVKEAELSRVVLQR